MPSGAGIFDSVRKYFICVICGQSTVPLLVWTEQLLADIVRFLKILLVD